MTITLNRPTPYQGRETASRIPVLDVVIPVYNEQDDLERCVRQLHEHLASTFPYRFRITSADNASTDDTLAISASPSRRRASARSRPASAMAGCAAERSNDSTACPMLSSIPAATRSAGGPVIPRFATTPIRCSSVPTNSSLASTSPEPGCCHTWASLCQT